jgi:hypothetical protein
LHGGEANTMMSSAVLLCCPFKSLSFARISYSNAQAGQNHGETESCREKDRGAILDDSVRS